MMDAGPVEFEGATRSPFDSVSISHQVGMSGRDKKIAPTVNQGERWADLRVKSRVQARMSIGFVEGRTKESADRSSTE